MFGNSAVFFTQGSPPPSHLHNFLANISKLKQEPHQYIALVESYFANIQKYPKLFQKIQEFS